MEQKQRIFMLFFQLHFNGMTGCEQCWKLWKQSFLLRTELLSGVWRTCLKWNKKVSQQLKMNCSTQPGRKSRWKSNKSLRWAARTLHPATIYRRFKEMQDTLSDIHSTEAFIHRQLSSKRFAFFSLFTLFVRSHKNYIEFSTSNGISVTVITPHSAMHTERIDMEKDVGPMSPTRENTKKHLLSHLYRFSLLSGFEIDCGLTESTIIAKRFINIDFGVSKSKSYFLVDT